MTKTLTEQFMDGSFKCNVYYCQTKYDGLKLLLLYHDGCEHGYAQKFGECEDYPHKDIIEVLAPVPSYDEWERLQKQLNEANEALKSLIGGDKNTLYYLEKILPMCEHDKVLHDYLQKIINDFENDLKKIEKWGVK